MKFFLIAIFLLFACASAMSLRHNEETDGDTTITTEIQPLDDDEWTKKLNFILSGLAPEPVQQTSNDITSEE